MCIFWCTQCWLYKVISLEVVWRNVGITSCSTFTVELQGLPDQAFFQHSELFHQSQTYHITSQVTCDSCGDPNSFFHCLCTSNTFSVFQCHLRIHLHCSNCICNDACFFALDTTIWQNIPVLSATLICHLASFRQNSTKQCTSASTSMSVTGM